MRYLIVTAVIILSFCGSVSIASVETSAVKELRCFVEEYVSLQYHGQNNILQPDKISFTKVDDEIKHLIESGEEYDIKHRPFVAVASYTVQEVVVGSDMVNGTATIRYKKIASTVQQFSQKGRHYTKIIPDCNYEDVRYKLIFKDKRWTVVDPPTPRVSYKAIIREYEDYFKYLRSTGVYDVDKDYKVHLKASNKGYSDYVADSFTALKEISCK